MSVIMQTGFIIIRAFGQNVADTLHMIDFNGGTYRRTRAGAQ